jgi:hypothetical protein
MITTTRQPCASPGCFATFATRQPAADEVRHCNRAGPDGGHANRWDGQRWQVVTGTLQHDRS